MNHNYEGIIEIDSTKRFSKPHIKGTRINVSDILYWFASGMTIEGIISDYPELTKTQIKASLTYAAKRENNYRVAT